MELQLLIVHHAHKECFKPQPVKHLVMQGLIQIQTLFAKHVLHLVLLVVVLVFVLHVLVHFILVLEVALVYITYLILSLSN